MSPPGTVVAPFFLLEDGGPIVSPPGPIVDPFFLKEGVTRLRPSGVVPRWALSLGGGCILLNAFTQSGGVVGRPVHFGEVKAKF